MRKGRGCQTGAWGEMEGNEPVARLFRGEVLLDDVQENAPRLKTRATGKFSRYSASRKNERGGLRMLLVVLLATTWSIVLPALVVTIVVMVAI